ncbi:MAG: RraA family protein [Oscillospiraceae bacterium]|nr:RraA family protein [Oscillospiraceae bacterium]MDD3833165.1 RraA family protein [Oscillospiraceae bacterium]MDD4545695.1 RraA family protein [Oscillospiraceae bacterium]
MQDKIIDNYERKPLTVDYDIEDIRNRYLKLYTALIYDALESIGLPGRSMDSGIYPLTVDMKVAGPAFTIRRQTTPKTDTYTHNIRLGLMKSMIDGCVMLSDVQGNKNCGQFGEITATAMRAAGCSGAVIDGSTRDSNYLINMNFPTFCRFRNPVEGLGRSVIIEYMIPIYINGIDGMLRVDPGDFIFGDYDGVVIVPKDKTVEVLETAENWFESEKASRKAMAEGMDPFEVYNTYGRF